MSQKPWRSKLVGVVVVVTAAIIIGLALSIYSDSVRPWIVAFLKATEPATVPIILITVFMIILGVVNSLWTTLSRETETPEPADADDKDAKKKERARKSEEVKRQIQFDAVLAGITLVLYLIVIMLTESLTTLTEKVALILAILPGATGLCHHVFAVGSHFLRRQSTVEAYKEFRERYDRARRGDTEAASPLDELAQDNPEDYTPPLPQTFFAALLITAVFLVPASMTKHRYFLRPSEVKTTNTGTPPQTDTTATTATIAPTAAAAKSHSQKDPNDDFPERKKDLIGLVNGLFYAGLGAYVWTLYLLVTRINTAALTSRFLINSAVRAAMGIAIGAAVALFGPGMFDGGASGPALLFAIGLLPQWALTTLRSKAKDWFGVKEDGCETLPLCLVDGLNDGLIDLLNEFGVGDVEHLANADPGELTLQTLFPLSRVVNWIDQALLIQEVRGDIVSFRKVGIACATDLALLHGEFIGTVKLARAVVPPPATPPDPNAPNAPAPAPPPGLPYDPQAEAKKVYAALASAISRPEEVLHIIGRKLYGNYMVSFLWNLWNMPGSIWTGWVAEVAEWMPAIFEAATDAATITKIRLMPEPSWDGRIGVIAAEGQEEKLPTTFIPVFRQQLNEKLAKLEFMLDDDPGEPWWTTVFQKAVWWRDIVQPIFPLVRPRARKR